MGAETEALLKQFIELFEALEKHEVMLRFLAKGAPDMLQQGLIMRADELALIVARARVTVAYFKPKSGREDV